MSEFNTDAPNVDGMPVALAQRKRKGEPGAVHFLVGVVGNDRGHAAVDEIPQFLGAAGPFLRAESVRVGQ